MNLGPLEPYAATVRLAALGVVGAAVIGLGVSWHLRGREIEKLHTWQDQVATATAVAGGMKDLDPEDVVTVIQVLGANVTEYRDALDDIDAKAKEQKRLSDANDAALRAALAEQKQRYAAAARKIESLSGREAAPSAEAAAAQIETDSKAAWEGWSR